MGPPGCGKTRLMVDLVAAATEGSPYRAATADRRPCPTRMPACTSKATNLMCHKALLTFNVGYPAQTITSAMRMVDWRPKHGGNDACYLSGAAGEVAGRKLHVLEERQSVVQHLKVFATRFAKALQQHRGSSDAMMRECAHVFSMDPLQSACREYGVKSVDVADGGIEQEDRRMVMPCVKIMECFGMPSAALKYKVIVMHDNFSHEGLLYRLLRCVYVDPSYVPLHPACKAMWLASEVVFGCCASPAGHNLAPTYLCDA